MLTEIYCSAFGAQKTIPFSAGLNVIQGIGGDSDEDSSNSIGKTTMLKIIDYAFGGTYYADSNEDIIRHVNDHNICFTHKFNGISYYFSRNASNPNVVIRCSDNHYTPKSEISTKEFCKWLLSQYGLQDLQLSFREIVGLYSRIWNKPNKEVNRPLYNHSSQAVRDSIVTLIKLFGKYSTIQELHEQEDYLRKRQNILSKASNYHFLHVPTKAEQSKLEKELLDIQNKISEVKANVKIGSNENYEQLSKSTCELYEQRAILSTQRSRVRRTLQRCKHNMQKLAPLNESVFTPLLEFFPDIDLAHIKEVQSFHDNLRNILLNELKQEEQELLQKLDQLDSLIVSNDQEIEKFTGLPTRTDDALEQLQNMIKRQMDIQSQLALYKDKIAETAQRAEYGKALSEAMDAIVQEIECEINNRIREYSVCITTNNNKAPIFHLGSNKYSYGVEDNTGTGKAYTDLLLFDITILSLTCLPFIIHDSFLFNNIDDFTIQSFLKLYSSFSEKQLFIALDQFYGKENEEIDHILYAATRLVLSSSTTLFGQDWRTT